MEGAMTDLVPVLDAELVPADDDAVNLRDGWLKDVADSEDTMAAYLRGYDEWLAYLRDEAGLEQAGILHVRRQDVTDYRRHMEKKVNPVTGKPYSPATVAQKIAIVSSFYNYCEQVDAIVRNPAAKTRRPKVDPDHSETTGLTADEAQRLISQADQFATNAKTNRVRVAAARDAAILVLMLCTGGRVSEVTSALIEDLGYDRGHRVLFINRKGNKRQSVALGDAARIVDRHVANEGRESGPIFQTYTGQPVDRAHVSRVIRKVALAAVIPSAKKLGPHSLRHTFATLAFDAGADISEVQDAMGHKDPRTTRRYDRARNRIDRSPVHAVSQALLGGGK